LGELEKKLCQLIDDTTISKDLRAFIILEAKEIVAEMWREFPAFGKEKIDAKPVPNLGREAIIEWMNMRNRIVYAFYEKWLKEDSPAEKHEADSVR